MAPAALRPERPFDRTSVNDSVSYDEDEKVSGGGPTAGDRSTALLRAALALSEHRELADVLSLILTSARSLAQARYAALAVYDEHGEIETFVHQGVDDDAATLVGAPPRGHGLLGELIMAGGPIRLDDITADARFGGFPAHHPQMRAFLGVPVTSSRRRYGNLYLGAKETGSFDAEDERLLATLAAFAAAAIENVHLLDAERDLAAAREREHVRTEMLGQVIEAQEAERARVARDLHDEIGQSLTSVLLGLRLVEDSLARPDPDVEDCRARTAEVRELVADALRQARTLAFDLRPTVLDDLGLVAAVRRLVEEVGGSGTPMVDLAVHNLDDDSRLTPEVETVVYRVVQEALTNVVRHAGATSASVVIARDAGKVRAVVEDDGHGFDLRAAHRPSLGLGGMAERAELVGGSVTIDSADGRGTTVRLEVPVG